MSDEQASGSGHGEVINGIDQQQAHNLVWRAVESIGGPQNVYRNPRMAFAFNAVRNIEVDTFTVEIRYGEISTPAIGTVNGWVYEIHDKDIELLMKPVKRHPSQG